MRTYKALLTQTGTNAPTAVVLENQFAGEVTWAYDSEGNYVAELPGAFIDGRTGAYGTCSSPACVMSVDVNGGAPNQVLVKTYNVTANDYRDNALYNSYFIIEVN